MELTHRWQQRWWGCSNDFPAIGPAYSLRAKLDREDVLAGFIDRLLVEAGHPPHSEVERAALEQRLVEAARHMVFDSLDLEEPGFETIEESGFFKAAAEFARKARRFDPSISGEAIYQASRNVWTMNLIQFLFGLPVQVTPAIFAYSMLYPYSDNLLDDVSISPAAKQDFSRRFASRLKGEPIEPANPTEAKIFELVGMVNNQYDRKAYPQIYESLLAIHTAQARSLALLRGESSPYEVDVLGIAFEKGGTSVLADGYLVAGDLTPGQRDFLFGYGAFTQLMDDQEDIELDHKAGCLTVFSQTAQGWPLDTVTNRLFHFAGRVMEQVDDFERPGVRPVRELITRSIYLLLAMAACRLPGLYTRDYLHTLESFLPFRMTFIERQRRRLERQQAALARIFGGDGK